MCLDVILFSFHQKSLAIVLFIFPFQNMALRFTAVYIQITKWQTGLEKNIWICSQCKEQIQQIQKSKARTFLDRGLFFQVGRPAEFLGEVKDKLIRGEKWNGDYKFGCFGSA